MGNWAERIRLRFGNSREQLASLGGVNANANSVFIEGTFNREPQNATVSVLPSIEGIEEVQIYTGKYNAEFGFSGSAVVNVITKSGSNEYHGAAFEYLRNQATDARPFFAESKTPFRRNQFGGAFGGPSQEEQAVLFRQLPGHVVPYVQRELYHRADGENDSGRLLRVVRCLGKGRGRQHRLGSLYDPFSRVIQERPGGERDAIYREHHPAQPVGCGRRQDERPEDLGRRQSPRSGRTICTRC